jgi:hypothetical protein
VLEDKDKAKNRLEVTAKARTPKAKTKARPLEAKATKLCHRGSSRLWPGLDDYITGFYR